MVATTDATKIGLPDSSASPAPRVTDSHEILITNNDGIDAVDWARCTRWITPLPRELLDRPIEPGLSYTFPFLLRAPRSQLFSISAFFADCSLDPRPLPLNCWHEKETGLYFAGDYNLRGRTPKSPLTISG